MDFLRVGGAVLRSSQPLLPFLAPSACRANPQKASTSRQYGPQQWHQCQYMRRRFGTSHTAQQQQSSATARKSQRDDGGDGPSPPSTRQTPPQDDISALLDGALDGDKGVPTTSTGRTSRFKTPGAQRANRTRDTSAMDFPPPRAAQDKGSVDEMISSILDTPIRQNQNQNQPTSRQCTPTTSPLNDVASMLQQPSLTPPPLPLQHFLAPSPIKLNSSVGRSIPVSKERGVDVGRAFRMLEMRCAQNSVKRDFQRQRFHERAGLKRKRLKGERWRRRFKEQFQGTVRRVLKMRRMGW